MPQAAVEAANSEPGVIQLAAGTYRLSRPLVITRSGVVLRGDGVRALAGERLFLRPLQQQVCGRWLPALRAAHLLRPAPQTVPVAGCPHSLRANPPPDSRLPASLVSLLQEGETKILIDRSLADVYNATWTLDGSGELLSVGQLNPCVDLI